MRLMADKKNEEAKDEEDAWQEYLKSLEAKKPKAGKGGNPVSRAMKGLLEKIGVHGKERPDKELEKQVSISAREGKKAFEKEKAAEEALAPETRSVGKKFDTALKALAGEMEGRGKGKPLKIDKYIEKLEEEKSRKGKGIGKEPPYEKWKKAKRKEEKKGRAGQRKGAMPLMKRPEPSKKVSFLPSALSGMGAGVRTALGGKGGGKEKPGKKVLLLPEKATGREKAKVSKKGGVKPVRLAKLKKAELEKILGKKSELVKKSVAELKKLGPERVKEELKKEQIKSKARGWFGESLKHRKAALKGWHFRRKVALHKLNKKARKGKLGAKSRARKKTLLTEVRAYKKKLSDVEKQIRSLKKIDKSKKKESKRLAKKMKKAGIRIPKGAIKVRGRKISRIKDMRDVAEIAEAMKSVADEVAAATLGRKAQILSQEESLSIDDQIKAQERLIKELEMAFYKRRVGFNQFREKMFEYQSKLSQLRIQKKLLEKRGIKTGEPPQTKELKVGVTPRAVRKLGELVEGRQGFQESLEKRASQLMKKLGEQRIGREEEARKKKEEERKAEEKREEAKRKAEEERRREAGRKAEEEKKKAEKARQKPVEVTVTERHVGAAQVKGLKKLPDEFVEDIRRKVSERIGEKAPETKKAEEKEVVEAIRHKGMEGNLSKKSLQKVEKKIEGLMKKYNIPASVISRSVNSLRGDRLVQDFQKLIELIEEKKEDSTSELIKPFDVSSSLTSKKAEKIVGKEKEIKKIRIETAFDRLLNLVQMKGDVKLGEAASELGMSKREVQECAEILESNKLIKLVYPAIGSVRLVYPGYLKWKAEQKKEEMKARKEKKAKK